MKIFGINNNQIKHSPAFKGVYIVKGDWTDVEQICKKILHKEDAMNENSEYLGIPLTSIYSDTQLNTQFLFATNEHKQNVRDYISLYSPLVKGKFIILGQPYENVSPLKQKVLSKCIDINRENFHEYELAEKAMEQDNFTPMTEILFELAKEAKDTLKRFIFCSSVPMDEIKKLDAQEVLEAIENDSFDYVEGRILN